MRLVINGADAEIDSRHPKTTPLWVLRTSSSAGALSASPQTANAVKRSSLGVITVQPSRDLTIARLTPLGAIDDQQDD
jgi:hypothetical protein